MEFYKEVERSIITTYRPKIWAKFVKAIKEYELLKENDRVCVCISGGKDSMIMAKCFQELQRHSDFPFEVKYLVMNPGYNQINLDRIKTNLQLLNIDATIVDTDIFAISNIQPKNPCYLCAKMRRGALYRIAQDMGCNKIALGHHFDDVIETIMMNILNAGSFQTMMPKLHSDNYERMELIRPLYLVREKDIITWKNHWNLEFIACACRLTEHTSEDTSIESESKRKATKNLIRSLLKYNDNVEKNIFSAASNVNLDKVIEYKTNGQVKNFLETYDNEEK